MKLSGNYNVGGEIAKEDERYKVVDNTTLKGLVLSSTDLNPGHSTSGHKHAGQEEVYMFIRGKGGRWVIFSVVKRCVVQVCFVIMCIVVQVSLDKCSSYFDELLHKRLYLLQRVLKECPIRSPNEE